MMAFLANKAVALIPAIGFALVLVIYVGVGLIVGQVPSQNRWVSKANEPGLFWACVGIAGFGLVVIVVMSAWMLLIAPGHP